MKVIAINGSANKAANTAIALDRVCGVLAKNGVQTERIEIGKEALHGCIGCGYCGKNQNLRCVFNDDMVNGMLKSLVAADGILIGSPVYYAGINGALKSYLDRAFFATMNNGQLLRHKAGAAVVAVRRGGEVAAWEQINKYFTISEMYLPSGNYWNMVFGPGPGEAARDGEGMQTMDLLGQNMAWLLRALEQGRSSLPEMQEKSMMNFIR